MPDLPMADRHETTLPPTPDEVAAVLDQARATDDADERRAVVGRAVGSAPAVVEGWVELSELGRDPIERYAYARVGYHRGLDALRAHGWGGRGLVRWSTPSNRPFLRCLVQLRAAAAEIGEASEVERLTTFLHDLDPDWDDAVVTG